MVSGATARLDDEVERHTGSGKSCTALLTRTLHIIQKKQTLHAFGLWSLAGGCA